MVTPQTISWSLTAKDIFPQSSIEQAQQAAAQYGGVAVATKTVSGVFKSELDDVNGLRAAAQGIAIECVIDTDAGIFPIDICSNPSHVIEGDAHQGFGTIIDARTAHRFGIHAGDAIELISYYTNPQGTIDEQQPFSIAIDAVVEPTSGFSGIATFLTPEIASLPTWQPFQDTLAPYVLENYASDVYVFGIDESLLEACCADLRATLFPNAPEGYQVAMILQADELQRIQAQIDRNGRGISWIIPCVIIGVLVLIVALFDAAIKARRRTRDYASFVSTGASPHDIARFAACEAIVVQVALGLIGFAIGAAQIEWFPGSIFAITLGIVIGVFAIAGLFQALVITRSLRDSRLVGIITTEGE